MAKTAATAAERLVAVLGADAVLTDDSIGPDYCVDETLKALPVRPSVVVLPSDDGGSRRDVAIAAESRRRRHGPRGRHRVVGRVHPACPAVWSCRSSG